MGDQPATKDDPAIQALNERRQKLINERQRTLSKVKEIDDEIDEIIESMNELADCDELVNALTGNPLENNWDPVREMELLYDQSAEDNTQ